MLLQDSLFLQAAIFTGTSVGFIVISVWWLYFSPLRNPIKSVSAPSSRLAGWLAVLLGLSGTLWVVGALWDASMHVKTGEIPGGADFLWPPHLLLYSGFFLALIVAVIALGRVALPGWKSGERDPRLWFRQNPYLGAVTLASLYELMALPGDALWHEIFGEDLTAWSPPHLLLAATTAVVIICAIGVVQQSPLSASRKTLKDTAVIGLLGLMLNMLYIVGVLEWELPVGHHFVDARPIWYYPLVGGAAAFFTFVLAKRLVNSRWAATATAATFYTVRLAITAALGLTDNIAPAIPLVFMLGAVLMDVLPWKRLASTAGRGLAAAASFTTGYAVLALPLLWLYPNIEHFTVSDAFISAATSLAASLIIFPIANLTSNSLLGKNQPTG